MNVLQYFDVSQSKNLSTCTFCAVELNHKGEALDLVLYSQHLTIHCAKVPADIKLRLKLENETSATKPASKCPFKSGQSNQKFIPVRSLPSHETEEEQDLEGSSSPKPKGIYYHEYLQLDKVLDAQALESAKFNDTAHDEHLFIIIHQTYELWFKQILYEIDYVRDLMTPKYIPEQDIGLSVASLNRISEIFRVINTQLTILETMTPLGFMDFRDYLFPASGFQSVQFRLIENKLGLQPDQRIPYGKRGYCTYLNAQHAEKCQLAEGEWSIHDLLQQWLERTPFLDLGGFSFWKHYKDATHNKFTQDLKYIQKNKTIPDDEKKTLIEDLETTYSHYAILYDQSTYDDLKNKGQVRLSLRAMQAALLIMLYQEEPILQLPHKLLMHLLDIDQHLTQWRYRHASMVHRMIGSRMGTGGSSGYNYLRATASQHRIFKDLFQLPTFLIPRKEIPSLPGHITSQMSFSMGNINLEKDQQGLGE